ncbi:hypothetical protein ABGB18_02850 [Nonomuraea sp. B12E4]|uniref:hypothetical protein n=1 Tax=Nonomuraea sp. B12E4 TaxID=3153564 RepID=UPI00325D6E36
MLRHLAILPRVKIGPLGFGANPMSEEFGARVFETGPAATVTASVPAPPCCATSP